MVKKDLVSIHNIIKQKAIFPNSSIDIAHVCTL